MESPFTFGNQYYPLSKRQWLRQTLPGTFSDFGPTPSRRDEVHYSFQAGPWDVSGAVDNFVDQIDDSVPYRVPIQVEDLAYNESSEATASNNFQIILRRVGHLLGFELLIQPNAQSISPRPHVDASQQAVMLASSSVQKAHYGVSANGRQFLVVEMKRPAVFRTTANSAKPNLCTALLAASRPSPLTETVVSVEPVFQLYSISPRLLGALAYMVDKAFKEPILFKSPDMKHAQGGSLHAFSPASSQSQDSQGGSEGREGKERSRNLGLHSMKTQSYSTTSGRSDGLLETPAELLHLAPHHFATGWSGRIVRGTYEGQRIVVKLAPTGSDRAEALLTEVVAYHKLKEFWGKYVPKLVSYGTTAGGKAVYIATEEIDGREIGMGTLSQEVVKEIFDALTVVHLSGILHGDIRRSNILVVEGRQAGVRLIDSGFSCLITSSEDCMREHAQLECLLNEFTCSDVGVIRQSQLGV